MSMYFMRQKHPRILPQTDWKCDRFSSLGRDGPDEPCFERLLDNHEKPPITRTVEQDVDRGARREKKVGYEGAEVDPAGPLVHDHLAQQRTHQLEQKKFWFLAFSSFSHKQSYK